jgi:hypothetical protein
MGFLRLCFLPVSIKRARGIAEGGAYPEIERLKKVTPKKVKKGKNKRTALILCRDRKQFWTTQAQFWQWVRDGVVMKMHDNPLTGSFVRDYEELMVVLSNTVLNLAYPNHLREALLSRRMRRIRK